MSFTVMCVTDHIVNVSFFKPLQRRRRETNEREEYGLENEICKIREWRGMEKEERRKGKEKQNKTYTLFLAKTAITSARE